MLELSPEQFAFSIFRQTRTEEYKRTLIMLVYSYIKDNGTVSESKLHRALQREHHLPIDDIESALSALKSPLGFDLLCYLQETPRQEVCVCQPVLHDCH
jgi:hypothetical protein